MRPRILSNRARNSHLSQLEREVAAAPHGLGPDGSALLTTGLDELLPEARERPVADLIGQGERPQEVGQVAGEGEKPEPHGDGSPRRQAALGPVVAEPLAGESCPADGVNPLDPTAFDPSSARLSSPKSEVRPRVARRRP